MVWHHMIKKKQNIENYEKKGMGMLRTAIILQIHFELTDIHIELYT